MMPLELIMSIAPGALVFRDPEPGPGEAAAGEPGDLVPNAAGNPGLPFALAGEPSRLGFGSDPSLDYDVVPAGAD